MTLYSLPILHEVIWDYTKDFTMRNHHPTVWTVAIYQNASWMLKKVFRFLQQYSLWLHLSGIWCRANGQQLVPNVWRGHSALILKHPHILQPSPCLSLLGPHDGSTLIVQNVREHSSNNTSSYPRCWQGKWHYCHLPHTPPFLTSSLNQVSQMYVSFVTCETNIRHFNTAPHIQRLKA